MRNKFSYCRNNSVKIQKYSKILLILIQLSDFMNYVTTDYVSNTILYYFIFTPMYNKDLAVILIRIHLYIIISYVQILPPGSLRSPNSLPQRCHRSYRFQFQSISKIRLINMGSHVCCRMGMIYSYIFSVGIVSI